MLLPRKRVSFAVKTIYIHPHSSEDVVVPFVPVLPSVEYPQDAQQWPARKDVSVNQQHHSKEFSEYP